METPDSQVTERDNELLDQIVADYVRSVEDGGLPDRDQLVAEHPEFEEELREFFRHRDRMEALLDPLRDAATRVLHVRCPHCHGAIELLDHVQVTDLSCPSCGTHFSLVGAKGKCYPNGLKRIGQFQLVEQVGMGQFGSVWKARDLTLERTVAIKFPRSRQLDESETEMFLRDARLAAQLNHPNIVGVHEVGKQDGTIFIVTDFIHGKTLKQWAATKRLTAHEAAGLCAKVARALHHAHELGVIHRDLKPGNIMMDLVGEPHVVDFGLAKRDSGEITLTLDGQILGTPAYMSPEQARGEGHTVDRRADVFAMGVILFELLTGELPFRGDQQMLLVQIRNDPPPNPRKFNAGVPRDLETICLMCLEKEPQRRYESAEMFADDCERFLNGRPVIARPISRLAHVSRWCRRKPLVAGLLATVATLLLGIAVASSIGLWATQSALKLAREYADTNEQNLYYSQMNRAGIAATDPDGLALIASTLDQWRPEQTLVDRRGWEWSYLEALLHQNVATLQMHRPVFSVAWSPDGARLAAAAGSTVTILGSDGRVIHRLVSHTNQVNAVNWSQDGARLASAGFDGVVNIWDAERGVVMRTWQHEGQVVDADWSHDDRQFAVALQLKPKSAEPSFNVTIWATEDWRKEGEYAMPGRILNLGWHPRQPIIAIGTHQGPHIWDVVHGEETQLSGQGAVAWNDDGTRLAAGDVGKMNVWDVTGAEPRKTEEFDIEGIRFGIAAWNSSGSMLAYVQSHKCVGLAHVERPTRTELLTLQGHLNRVTDVNWHPRGDRIATASVDGTVRIWRTPDKPPLAAGSYAISWSPDGSRYVSTFRDSVLICDPAASRPVKRLRGHACQVYAVSWSPDGQRVASASLDHEIRVWDAESGKVIWQARSIEPNFRSSSPLPTVLAWSHDGHRLAFPQAGFEIGVVDATNGRLVRKLTGHHDVVQSLAWSPDGSHIVSGGRDGVLRVWNSVTGQPAKSRPIRVAVNAVCWSPDSSQIAGATSDNVVYIWDLETLPGPPLHRLGGHTNYVYTVSWNSDGERIASADESGAVRIWDARTGQQTLRLSYPRSVPMVAWNPDGKRLACVGFGGSSSVRIWSATVEPSERVYWSSDETHALE